MNHKREEILTLGIGRLFIKLAIPGMIGTLIMGLYNFVDAIFIGQFVGKDGVGAISLVYSVVLVNQAILTLIGIGSMSLTSRAIGENDQRTTQRLLGNLTFSISILSIVLSVLVFNFAYPLVKFLGGGGNILYLGVKYLKIISIGFVFASLGPAMNMLIRGEGRMKEAMLIASTGMVLNIILDPIFIYVLGMGIQGAAVATVISQIMYVIIGLVYFRLGRSVIKLNLKDFKLAFDLLPKILNVGNSAMIMFVMAAIQQIILFKSLTAYGGSDHVALMGASYRVFLSMFIPLAGAGQGLQPIIGINYGGKNFDRVKESFKSFTLIATIIASILWLSTMLFPQQILSWFITDSELVNRGQEYFRIFFSVSFILGLNLTILTMFQAIGKGVQATILSLSTYIFFFIPLVLILPISKGVLGVWLSIPIADTLRLFMGIIFLAIEYRKLNIAPLQLVKVSNNRGR